MLEAGEAEELWHLGDVAEHVRQIADRHGSAESLSPVQAELQVTDDGLARHTELVHQDVPRPHRQAAVARQAADAIRGVRADREVVVDDGELAVEQEPPKRRVLVQVGQKAVQHAGQAISEAFEGGIPLPVPVGVGDDHHRPLGFGAHGRPRRRFLAVWRVATAPSSHAPPSRWRCSSAHTPFAGTLAAPAWPEQLRWPAGVLPFRP